jgi:cellobiose phosphorylase
MLYGFLGFEPTADGFNINPQLPKEWPELTVTRIHLHQFVIDITVRDNTVMVKVSGQPQKQLIANLPGDWKLESNPAGLVTF